VPDIAKSNDYVGQLFSNEDCSLPDCTYPQRFVYHLTISVHHTTDFVVFILVLYFMLFLISLVMLRLIRRRDSVDQRMHFESRLSILLFLPVLLFTYRTSYAPPWVTLFDIWTIVLLIAWTISFLVKTDTTRTHRPRRTFTDHDGHDEE
jgi:amino acid transporter